MGRRSSKFTSLFAVIEGMQRRLEAEGLEREVVDAAVTRGLEALLEVEPPVRAARRERPSLWIRQRALAKA